MIVTHHKSSSLVLAFVMLLSLCLPAAAESNADFESNAAVFTSIEFVSNIETIGVVVSGTSLPATAELSYRQSGESFWRSGHHLIRIDDGRLVGSLFNLLSATDYEVEVIAGTSEISGSTSTQTDQLSFTPSVILHVDDDAALGGNGSAAAPYKTIQEAVNHAGPGTQVLVANGVYREAVTFPASGARGQWIQVKASGGAAILDSADRLTGNIWTAHSTSKVWFKTISGPVAYVARDGNRYYQYNDKTGLMQAIGHAGVTISQGWYYEPSTSRLYVRSQDNPANHTWRIPRLNHAFDVSDRDWIWIEGFEIRYYGTTTNGCGVCSMNASHLVVRKNNIHNMQLGIFVNWNGTDSQGNDTRIEGNEVYDPLVNEWPWAAVKGSFMEGTGIIVRGHNGAIVRNNLVHNFFNGIYTGSSGALENSELAFDADIYNNYVHHVSDDALEPEGACINQRFRNNIVDMSFIGISVAPVTKGPTWFLHSTFSNITGRGIKFADHSDGIVLIYHNTVWTNASNVNGMDLITPVHNVVMRNNIFESTGYSFAEVPTGSTGNDWNWDSWYTTRGSTGPHFKWENVNYNTISTLCLASGLECDGNENLPGFVNPTGGDFTLLSSSPNIDRGVVLSGINDNFIGNAPDVGAYEFTFDLSPTVLSSVRADSNPTNASIVNFKVTFSEPVTGVNLIAPFEDFSLGPGPDLAEVAVTGVTSISDSTYMISVYTGSGNGTLRLDVVDDDSIQDPGNRPLGGVGEGNGNFTSGEEYTIIKTKSTDTAGVFRPSNGLLYLKNTHTSGFADIAINYGLEGDYPVAGDWDGDGDATIGIYRNGSFYLRDSNTVGFADRVFAFGVPSDQPIAGDWDGDGDDTIGVYRRSTATFYLRNSNSSGAPDITFSLGLPGDVGIAGDWTGKGYDTTGVFRPSNGALYLKNTNSTGYADIQINYGLSGDKPVTGDWNDDGYDTIGIYRNGIFYLRNSNTIGYADIVFALGVPGDVPIAGNWDGEP